MIEEFTAPGDSPEPILPAAPPPQVSLPALTLPSQTQHPATQRAFSTPTPTPGAFAREPDDAAGGSGGGARPGR